MQDTCLLTMDGPKILHTTEKVSLQHKCTVTHTCRLACGPFIFLHFSFFVRCCVNNSLNISLGWIWTGVRTCVRSPAMHMATGFTKLRLLACPFSYSQSAGPARDADGRIPVSKTKFPSGFKNLTSYIHSKGLKIGIYTAVSHWTCGGYVIWHSFSC